MTKFQLFSMLTATYPQPVVINGTAGYLQSIQREDGSGKSFNITLLTVDGVKTVYVRTID